jgi:hypothetical protein
MSEEPIEFIDWEGLGVLVERFSPSSLAAHIDPTRPYDGQPHTTNGIRGATLVEGLTMRDIRDCYVRACYESSGLPPKEWPGSIYDLPWDEMDPIAIVQNLTCEIERMMGIFPNIPRLERNDDD